MTLFVGAWETESSKEPVFTNKRPCKLFQRGYFGAGKYKENCFCHPRGGLVQGWESLCWGVEGIPWIENIGFFVSWSLGFKVPKIQSCKISNIQRFKQQYNSFNVFWQILIICYQIFISCFVEDIDPILKIFKNRRLFGILRSASSTKSKHLQNKVFRFSKNES